jgi:hypothetical protein
MNIAMTWLYVMINPGKCGASSFWLLSYILPASEFDGFATSTTGEIDA